MRAPHGVRRYRVRSPVYDAGHTDESSTAASCAAGGQGIARAEWLIYERFVPAVPTSVARLRWGLGEVLVENELAPTRRGDIALVMTEAAANVVAHAYAGGVPGPLYAGATLTDQALTVSVVDFGRAWTRARRTRAAATALH